LCRGTGVIELVANCTTVIASITCLGGGARPWTATSATFDPSSNVAWNLRVRSPDGTNMEWWNPQVVLF
ncbi:MAG: hypothetical protein QME96_17220, partial [Myxococcota bacterium]|nr:hypothetical protein [Myxococcota bacterium]